MRCDQLRWHGERAEVSDGQVEELEELFKGRHFDREIVILCVRWSSVRV